MERTVVMSSGGFEGLADVGPYETQWQVRRCSVPACCTAPVLLPQRPAWVCTCGGDGHAVTVAGMAPRRPNAPT
jgi:hypothetical protein